MSHIAEERKTMQPTQDKHGWKHKITKKLRRNKQQLFKFLGNEDDDGDEQFAKEIAHYERFDANVIEITKQVARFVECMKVSSAAAATVSRRFKDFYGGDSPMSVLSDRYMQSNLEILSNIEHSIGKFKSKHSMEPNPGDIEKRLERREKLKLDYEYYRNKLKFLIENQTPDSANKIKKTKVKFEKAELEFRQNHASLVEDLAEMFDKGCDMVDSLFLDVVGLQTAFLSDASSLISRASEHIPEGYEQFLSNEQKSNQPSIRDLLADEVGRECFRRYLVQVDGTQMLAFISEVENIHSTNQLHELAPKINFVFSNFISEQAALPLTLSPEIVESTCKKVTEFAGLDVQNLSITESEKLVEETRQLFDSAFIRILERLEKQDLPKFLESTFGNDYMEYCLTDVKPIQNQTVPDPHHRTVTIAPEARIPDRQTNTTAYLRRASEFHPATAKRDPQTRRSLKIAPISTANAHAGKTVNPFAQMRNQNPVKPTLTETRFLHQDAQGGEADDWDERLILLRYPFSSLHESVLRPPVWMVPFEALSSDPSLGSADLQPTRKPFIHAKSLELDARALLNASSGKPSRATTRSGDRDNLVHEFSPMLQSFSMGEGGTPTSSSSSDDEKGSGGDQEDWTTNVAYSHGESF